VKWIAEVLAYPGNDAEVVLRFVSGDFDGGDTRRERGRKGGEGEKEEVGESEESGD